MPTDYDAVFGDIVFDSDGDVVAVQQAIDSGVDINCVANGDGWNLLHYILVPVMWAPNLRVLDVALRNGCRINAKDREGYTPLHFAARLEDASALAVLLEHGADPNIPNDKGVTPFHQYFLQGEIKADVVRLFIDKGGKPTQNLMGFVSVVVFEGKEQILPLLQAVET